jgi:hypothetical protein
MSSGARNDWLRPLRRRALGAAALAGVLAGASTADALDEHAGEAQAIKACDERLCRMLLQRNAAGEDLKCRLTKTWAKSTIKEADQRDLKWGFGDARCTLDIHISRAAVVSALNGGKESKFWAQPHTATCVVEQDGQVKPVKATLAPKIVFKHGKAEKIWINLMSLEGPDGIKSTLSTAAQLNDTVGIFHRAMIKSVNRFIYKHCPTAYPQLQAASTPAK